MNILLVDDDEYIIQTIRRRIHWDRLKIQNVYAAYNIRQAKELLARVSVQVMVCDIEMPQGSGLDLLEWIRRQDYGIQTIFLTSYAEFSYAQRAIELKSLNYYLKPVDYGKLEQGIREAVERAQEQSRQLAWKKESEYWKKNREMLVRNSFRSLFQKEGEVSRDALLLLIKNADLPYTPDSRFLPVWMELYDERKRLEKWEQMRLVLTIERLAGEACREIGIGNIIAVPMDGLSFALLLEVTEAELLFLAVQGALERLKKECSEKFHVDVFLGAGCEGSLLEQKAALEELKKICADNVRRESRVVSMIEHEDRELPYHLPAVTAWEKLLKENQEEYFLARVESWLKELSGKNELNQEILKLFRMDMLQLMYAVLKHTEVQAYRLLVNDTGERLYERAVRSVEDMMEFVRYLTQITRHYLSFMKAPEPVAEQIKAFLDENYTKEITRTDLAEIVYLNPDYISRLFKKEMGVSISSYLLKKRVDTAKELLEDTSMPINVISMYVGYNNFSYFTKVFRENTGMSPNEYRKMCRNNSAFEKN
ncbi:MAG: response regulator [Lachnospiraceae bacterium]|nr:response regulator [Lachnospiraceae bacterium]